MVIRVLTLSLSSFFLSCCAGPKIDMSVLPESDPAALSLLSASQRAHGAADFAGLKDISVAYDGKWALVGPRFQPVLVDRNYRGKSEERLLLPSRSLAQRHDGPAGVKQVLRAGSRIAVTRNGQTVLDDEERRAAELVADAYIMFLLGSHYFNRSGATFALAGHSQVDGRRCDDILVVLKPGFGAAAEDRVVLSVDQKDKLLRRVRLTLNGLESTRGAEVDVTFSDFERHYGVLWPRGFDERIRSPFDLSAHRWRLVGLDVNRGLRAADLSISGFRGKAETPAKPLP